MVERFTVENYMCYRREEVLSFVASNKEKDRQLPSSWYKEINGKRILRLLICVGLNGTGKSKMFSALSYLRMLAIDKPKKPTDRPTYRPFLLDVNSRNKPTILSLTYYVGEISYYYRVVISANRIEEEELRQTVSRSNVYHRSYNNDTDTVVIKYGPLCDLSKSNQRILEANVIPNSTVLSVFGALNLESRILNDSYSFFANHISLERRAEQTLADRLQTGNNERDWRVKVLLLRLLRDVGTNIVDYVIDDTNINIADLVKVGASEMVIKAMLEQYPKGFITHKNLRFIHSTEKEGRWDLDSGLESLGTMNIISLLVMMYDIVIGRKCSCIDEIEVGIHTKAIAFILKMYLSIADDCQIAVATHDLSLLGQPDLRRDAVRMFEKDVNGCTYIRKHEYVHNSVNFLNSYNKRMEPQLDKMLENVDLFMEYRRLIDTFLKELHRLRSADK